MKVLLLGAGGLMGRHLAREISSRNLGIAALTHADLDVCDQDRSRHFLKSENPDVVINAAALCSFEACENDPAASLRINLQAPQWWSAQCEQRGIRYVHFSSDYIFDGLASEPYTEEASPNPLCVYGTHKAEVERTLGPRAHVLILRVAWIFGKNGRTFMSLLPGLIMDNNQLRVASGKRGSCLHATTGAAATVDLVQKQATGVVNLVHRGETSWEEFAGFTILELHRRGFHPRCVSPELIPFQALNTGHGKRPDYSVLNVSRAGDLLGHALPDWQTGLCAYLDELGYLDGGQAQNPHS